MIVLSSFIFFFFFNDPAPTEIYTLSLHDALPISCALDLMEASVERDVEPGEMAVITDDGVRSIRAFPPRERLQCRSEEHTSELQSRRDLVCRLLLEKKKKKKKTHTNTKNTNR